MSLENKNQLRSLVREILREELKLDEELRQKLSVLERITRVEEELKFLRQEMHTRFEALQREMNARFEAIDRRFEAVDRRFEAVYTRFESLEKRFLFFQWYVGIGIPAIALLIAILRIFG